MSGPMREFHPKLPGTQRLVTLGRQVEVTPFGEMQIFGGHGGRYE